MLVCTNIGTSLRKALTSSTGSSIPKTHRHKDACDQAWEERGPKISPSPSIASLTTTQHKPKSTKPPQRTSSTASSTATMPPSSLMVQQVAERLTPSRMCRHSGTSKTHTDVEQRHSATSGNHLPDHARDVRKNQRDARGEADRGHPFIPRNLQRDDPRLAHSRRRGHQTRPGPYAA